MEILGMFLLVCLFVPFAGTHFFMYLRRRDFHDPSGWEAYRAGRQMGQICFALLLLLFSVLHFTQDTALHRVQKAAAHVGAYADDCGVNSWGKACIIKPPMNKHSHKT